MAVRADPVEVEEPAEALRQPTLFGVRVLAAGEPGDAVEDESEVGEAGGARDQGVRRGRQCLYFEAAAGELHTGDLVRVVDGHHDVPATGELGDADRRETPGYAEAG